MHGKKERYVQRKKHLEITALIKTENSGGGFVILLRLRKIQTTSLTLP